MKQIPVRILNDAERAQWLEDVNTHHRDGMITLEERDAIKADILAMPQSTYRCPHCNADLSRVS